MCCNRVYVIDRGGPRVIIDASSFVCTISGSELTSHRITHPKRMDSQELQKLNVLLDREVELREVSFLVLCCNATFQYIAEHQGTSE
jgi:hypothetical protein